MNIHNLGNALYFMGGGGILYLGKKGINGNLFAGDIKITQRFLVSFEITA